MKIKKIALSSMLAMGVFGVSFAVANGEETAGSRAEVEQAADEQVVELRDGHPDVYVVKKGDTLWDISATFLKDPWLWPEIWHVNPQVGNPHLIYPGDVLNLVYIDGRPMIQKTVKLSPTPRVINEGDAIDAIPMDLIRPFLNGSQVIDVDEYNKAPYIIGGRDNRYIYSESDRVFVRGLMDQTIQNYSVFRRGAMYVDPTTKEFLGMEAIHLADTRLQVYGDPAVFKLGETKQEVQKNDRVFPAFETNDKPYFYPHATAPGMVADIISVHGGVSQIGKYNIIVINKGIRDGMEHGHVMTVHKAGQWVKDDIATEREHGEKGSFSQFKDVLFGEDAVMVKLPDLRVGTALIFRTFEKVSYAIILDVSQDISLKDKLKTPE